METNVSGYNENAEFYGEVLALYEGAIATITSRLEQISGQRRLDGLKPAYDHMSARVKSAASMRAKLEARGLAQDVETAFDRISDGAGVRIVCRFLDDVYETARLICAQEDFTVVRVKDYIKAPKPNGYRSYHMIVRVPVDIGGGSVPVTAEIQIRTIALDCWASLEHQLKYKQEVPEQEIIVSELKRCADEIASTDINLQTIRDMLEALA